VQARLEERARVEPLDPGLPLAELLQAAPWTSAVLPLLGVERREAKAYLPGSVATIGRRAEAAARVEAELAEAGFDAVRVDDRTLAGFLEREGRLVRLGDGLAVGAAAYARARDAVIAECEREGSIRLARLRDLIGSSRRSAQLLLERLDADGLTRRVGDERVLRRAARQSR
jgi:selenocysteine-specific elongation factor